MNKVTCSLVQDLLPNYVEDLTSEETKMFIDNHVKTCPQCARMLNAMQTPIAGTQPAQPDPDALLLKRAKRRLTLRTVGLTVFAAVLLAIVIGSYPALIRNNPYRPFYRVKAQVDAAVGNEDGELLPDIVQYVRDQNGKKTWLYVEFADGQAVLADCLRDRLEAVYPDGWPEGTFDESAEYCYNGITREWN